MRFGNTEKLFQPVQPVAPQFTHPAAPQPNSPEAIIRQAEQVKVQIYQQMGSEYAALHHDDYEEALAPLMKKLFVVEAEVERCNTLILERKGLRKCTACGAEIPLQSLFCNMCGTKLEPYVSPNQKEKESAESQPKPVEHTPVDEHKTEQPGDMGVVFPQTVAADEAAKELCSNCGKPLQPGMRLCKYCGTPVNKPAAAVESVEEVSGCKVCGANLKPGAKFCVNCGTPR